MSRKSVVDRAHSSYAAQLLPKMELAPASIYLSARQLELLKAVGAGLTRSETALRLGLTPATVQRNWTGLIRKLHAKDQADAIIIAMRERLL